MSVLNPTNKQGGKAYREHMAKFESDIDEINKTFLQDPDYEDVEDMEYKLMEMKNKFIECDRDKTGELNVMDVKYLMEKLGQAKTHLEVVKMIAEVDTRQEGAINYTDFVRMMLGPKSSVLKKILTFEMLMKPKEKPKGLPPKRDLASLP